MVVIENLPFKGGTYPSVKELLIEQLQDAKS